MDVDDYLSHHGIRGQRWGIRNKVNPKTGRVSVDHRTTSDLRKKPKPVLTNKQLQTVNTRLGLEQNFDRLNPGTIKKGESHIKALVATTTLVSSVIAIGTSPVGKAVASFIKRNGSKVVKIKPGTSFI